MTAVCHLLLCLGPLVGATDPDAAVSSARKALSPWSDGYPWYDSRADGVRPVDVSKRWYENLEPLNFDPGTWWLRPLAWSVLAILAAVLVYFLVSAYRKRRRVGEDLAGEEVDLDDEQADERRREALPLTTAPRRGDLLAEARRLYQEGRYAEAILYLFSYQLFQLDKQRRIHLAKGKTNRQYLREVGPASPLRRLVEPTMIAFEDVFFGHRAIERGRFESCWLRLPEFEALAREGTV